MSFDTCLLLFLYIGILYAIPSTFCGIKHSLANEKAVSSSLALTLFSIYLSPYYLYLSSTSTYVVISVTPSPSLYDYD